MIRVETGYAKQLDFPRADEYHIDADGNLILSTGRCGQVAAFSAGNWLRAELIPNRGADGRFAKRGG